jgi:putative peptidoglycan lipid II flippase
MLSREQHANTLFEALPALGILFAVLLLPLGGATPLLWGTAGGVAFQLAALWATQRRAGETGLPRLGQTSPHWQAFWSGFGVMMAGQAIMSVTSVVDQFFAADLGTGAIASLGYANRVMALILGLGATAVSRATLPVFSRIQAEGGGDATRNVALRWSALMFGLAVPAVAVGWLLAPWLVKMLFQRGAFVSQDTVLVATILRYYLLQVPAYFSGIVFVSWLSSRSLYWVLLLVAIFGLTVKLSANFILVEIYGLAGVPLSTAFMYFCSTLSLMLYVLFRSNARAPGVLM